MCAQVSQPVSPSNKMLKNFFSVFKYSRRALELVWSTSKPLTVGLTLLTLIAGVLPAVAAYLGQLIVDEVVSSVAINAQGRTVDYQPVIQWVLLEALVLMVLAAAQRGLSAQQSILRALMGQRVNVMILEKAQTLSLAQFEDSEFYDKLTRARREASTRPLALVNKTFSLIQNSLALLSFSILLIQFSPWVLLILFIAALPVFISEAKFSGDAFQLSRWRSPELRKQLYLETLLAREDSIKEVKLFGLGPRLLDKYRDIFHTLFGAEKRLIIRRDLWGFVLGLLGTLAFYGAYVWIVVDTIQGMITLGQMTMFLLVFKQGQSAISTNLTAISGMYEDNLYLSNLYEYLEQPVEKEEGALTQGQDPTQGIVFDQVCFTYPGAIKPALDNVSFHLPPGQSLALVGENGSGKTTLIKLLTRLYSPSSGRILLDGNDLNDWAPQALRERVGVIFQDFVRYQLLVGENLGAGDVSAFDDEARWKEAARLGLASEFIDDLSQQYHTQLGRWFQGGQELSGGQWQKIALGRAFMRSKADILVLDEPTAAMDAEAEAQIFEHFRRHTERRMVILISHRFSSVRSADHIILMRQGCIIERGNHDSLLALNGRYAELFRIQAKGYQLDE